MATLWNSLRQMVTKMAWQPVVKSHWIAASANTVSSRGPLALCTRLSSNYNPYPEYEKAPSPFKPARSYKFGLQYKYKFYKGGVLPRPEGEFEKKPVKGPPKFEPHKKDPWSAKKACFGQNDYIDILGDGSLHPAQLMDGPLWLRGFKGNQMQRLIRRLKFEGKFLKEYYPSRYHSINKEIFFWYKRYNQRRRHAPFWGAGRKHNRIDRIHNRLG